MTVMEPNIYARFYEEGGQRFVAIGIKGTQDAAAFIQSQSAQAGFDFQNDGVKGVLSDMTIYGDPITKIRTATNAIGADVIFDPVGGDVFDESVRCIAFDGRLLVIGFTSGRIATLPSNMAMIKGFSLMGVRAGEYGRRFPEQGLENQTAVDNMAANGTIHPHAPTRLPLSNWTEAFQMMQERKVVGRAVLLP